MPGDGFDIESAMIAVMRHYRYHGWALSSYEVTISLEPRKCGHVFILIFITIYARSDGVHTDC